MKRVKRSFILFMFLFLAIGCGSNKPSGLSDEMYDTAVYVVKVVDSYLDGEANLEETYNIISDLSIPEYSDIDSDDADVYTSILNVKITLFSMDPSIGTQTITDLKESRNELAEKINYE